jgi:hypothetical protein
VDPRVARTGGNDLTDCGSLTKISQVILCGEPLAHLPESECDNLNVQDVN